MFLLVLCSQGALASQTLEERFRFSELHMGVRVDLALYAPNSALAEDAARAAYARIAALEDVFSDYRPTSEARRLGAQGGSPGVSGDMARVLSQSLAVARASDGAFDPTAGPLVALWRQARRDGRMPRWTALKDARTRTGWEQVRMEGRRVVLSRPVMGLDFGGIAKGDALDQALLALRRKGVKRAFIQAGGDIAASGAPPGEDGWVVQADAVPAGRLVIKDQAVSTSGDSEQFALIQGTRYSHIVDPRTGFGVTSRVEATVLARDGLTSDPLATALCVLGPKKGSALAALFGARAWFRVAKD
jgi:thiamine biosynthesis lipoprotein